MREKWGISESDFQLVGIRVDVAGSGVVAIQPGCGGIPPVRRPIPEGIPPTPTPSPPKAKTEAPTPAPTPAATEAPKAGIESPVSPPTPAADPGIMNTADTDVVRSDSGAGTFAGEAVPMAVGNGSVGCGCQVGPCGGFSSPASHSGAGSCRHRASVGGSLEGMPSRRGIANSVAF